MAKRKFSGGVNSFQSVKQRRKFKVVGQESDQSRATEKKGSRGVSQRKEALLAAISPATRVNSFRDKRAVGLERFQLNGAASKQSGRKARKSKFTLGDDDGEDGYQAGFNKGDIGRRQIDYSGKRGNKMDFIKKQKLLKMEKQTERELLQQKTEALDNEFDDFKSLISFAQPTNSKSDIKKQEFGGDGDYDDLVKKFETGFKGEVTKPRESHSADKSAGYAQKRQVQKEQMMRDDQDKQEQSQKVSKLEARQRERAAGNDPLQLSFRGAAAQLLVKYAITQKEGEEEELKEVEDQEDDDETDEDKEEDEYDDEEDDDEEEVEVLKQLIQRKLANANSVAEEKDKLELDLSVLGDAEQCLEDGIKSKKQAVAITRHNAPAAQLYNLAVDERAQNAAADDSSLMRSVPKSYDEFCIAVNKGIKEQRSLNDTINTIRRQGDVELMRDCRQALERFYGYVIQYFYSSAKDNQFHDLNMLLNPIQEMTQQISLNACSVARERILGISQEASKGKWPDHADLHMFKLWIKIFEFNEANEHSVLDALFLLFGQILSTVKIQSLQNIETGLLMIHLGNSLRAGVAFWPEAKLFLVKCLASMLPFDFQLWLTYCPEQRWLWIDSKQEIKNNETQFQLCPFETSKEESIEYKLCLIQSLLRLVLQFVETNSNLPSAAEVFLDFKLCLEQLQQHCVLSTDLQDTIQVIIQQIVGYSQNMRKALNQNCFKAAPSIKQHTPRFEEDEDAENYGKQRAQQRRLKRKVVKEERQAMRALRKDSAFVLDVREKQKYNAGEERDKKARRAISFLQAQEADFRSGGQAGMNPHLKKKK